MKKIFELIQILVNYLRNEMRECFIIMYILNKYQTRQISNYLLFYIGMNMNY